MQDMFWEIFEDSREDSDVEPRYVISVAARMVGAHAQTLRTYERLGLVDPARTQGNFRLYSERDIRRVHRIKMLIEDLGVNLAGVEVILRMSAQMSALQRRLQELASTPESQPSHRSVSSTRGR
jgi:MerR family transcriptional regulator/heat shock protein HspR